MDALSELGGDRFTAETFPGTELTLTIDSVYKEQLGRDDEQKDNALVVYFVEAEQGLRLNKTNGRFIVGLFGRDTDDWTGKQVQLYKTTCSFAGKEVDCIRIRAVMSPEHRAADARKALAAAQAEVEAQVAPAATVPAPVAAPVAATVPVAAPVAAMPKGDSIPF